MNTNLINKINEQLQGNPLIYVCVEPERALGIENLLTNYHIICYENSPLVEALKLNGINIYSIKEIAGEMDRKSSASVLAHKATKQIISDITRGGHFYLQTFHITKPFEYYASQMNCTLINNSFEISSRFEEKLSMFEIFSNHEGVTLPKGVIRDISVSSWTDLTQELGSQKLVVQNNRSHTGEGTYILSNEAEFLNLQKQMTENKVKIAEFIEGDTWTLNCCITKAGNFVHGLSYQITGIPQLTPFSGSTIGNDWSYAKTLNPDTINQLQSISENIAAKMLADRYKGLFGLDFIISDEGKVYLIEINARQTANIPMESYLEQINDQTPMAIYNLGEFMNLEFSNQDTYTLQDIEGAQIFNRAKKNMHIKSKLKVGIYRLQSDNSSIDWTTMSIKPDVIYIDEEQDKPLIFQKNAHSVLEIDQGGFLVLISEAGEYKINSELCRFQFKQGVITDKKAAPWVVEALTAIEHQLA